MQNKQKFNIFKTAIRGYKQLVTDDYQSEKKYLKSLSAADKEWLEAFISGYYFRNSKDFLKLNFTVKQRRESFNRHRPILNDMYSKCNRTFLKDFGDNNNDNDNY
jgi:ribosomal protein S17E